MGCVYRIENKNDVLKSAACLRFEQMRYIEKITNEQKILQYEKIKYESIELSSALYAFDLGFIWSYVNLDSIFWGLFL